MTRMKLRMSIAMAISLVLGASFWVSEAVSDPGPGCEVKSPPASLSQYYPPSNKKKVYALEMIALGRALGSFSTDVQQRSENWPTSGKLLIERYEKVSTMVPEWRAYFPKLKLPPVGAIDGESGWGRVEKVAVTAEHACTRCHVTEMFKVQAIYHWPRFSQVSVISESGDDITFHQTMIELSNSLAVIPNLARRGDWKGAASAKKKLGQQFVALEQGCEYCHDTTREYFVDKTVKGRVLKMGGLLRKKNRDAATYTRLSDEIYDNSCIPCHVLHMPAAFMQMQLKH